MSITDGEDTYEALHARVETFWLVCREALGSTFDSEANWTCSEIEALQEMLRGIADEDDLETLVHLHAAWSETPHAGDCECHDTHHQIWVDEWGKCSECGLEPDTEIKETPT